MLYQFPKIHEWLQHSQCGLTYQPDVHHWKLSSQRIQLHTKQLLPQNLSWPKSRSSSSPWYSLGTACPRVMKWVLWDRVWNRFCGYFCSSFPYNYFKRCFWGNRLNHFPVEQCGGYFGKGWAKPVLVLGDREPGFPAWPLQHLQAHQRVILSTDCTLAECSSHD